ncbi:NepR family anti-sigma factor [Parasphingorhabdus sp. DH2-15]|uniref:NepR family anti-sigma factor n=1 Tax=Parasphingorhabdus sp. DH2-15 TaxID=3444112 RepID=UPI003F684297
MTMNKYQDQGSGQDRNNAFDDSGDDAARSGSIGQALKSVYQQTVEEELPEDFQKLLDQLK